MQAVDVLERALALIGNRKYELFGTTGEFMLFAERGWLRGLAQLGSLAKLFLWRRGYPGCHRD